MLNLIQLIIGGIVFVTIMSDERLNASMLYISASILITALIIFALVFFKMAKKEEKKNNTKTKNKKEK